MGMSGTTAHRDRPGEPLPGFPDLPTDLAEPIAYPTGFVSRNRWASVPAENFLAWNALRLTEFARLVLQAHVPQGPLPVVVLHKYVSSLRLSALRCEACPGSTWPCGLVAWAHDWIDALPGIVEALDTSGHLVDGVSTPVAVGDVQVPAVTWDMVPTGGKGVG